ncbi:hypothetical protein E4U48_006969 [Claviceps purpurea]|nr:hypothetical protein E4U48_006969 [Claviceps purpurea]
MLYKQKSPIINDPYVQYASGFWILYKPTRQVGFFVGKSQFPRRPDGPTFLSPSFMQRGNRLAATKPSWAYTPPSPLLQGPIVTPSAVFWIARSLDERDQGFGWKLGPLRAGDLDA